MNELITIITDEQGAKVKSARELHIFLEVRTRFNDWFKSRVNTYRFLEGTDYVEVEGFTEFSVKPLKEVFHKSMKNSKGGRPEQDYALTLDMAKELAMVERTEKGREARLYFIEKEKQLRRLVNTPPTEQVVIQQTLLQQAQTLVEQANQLIQLKQELSQLQRKVAAAKQGPLIFPLSKPGQIVITPAHPDLDSLETHDLQTILMRVFSQKDSFRYSELLASMVKASAFVGPMLGRSRTQKLIVRAAKLGYLIKERDPGQQYPSYRLSQLAWKK